MGLFKKAEKSESKLRLALFGPAGAGKTFTSLLIAKGIGGTIALIDTERGSASKYADRFEFDTANIDQPTINNLVSTLNEAGKEKYDVVIIDSGSHAWQELLEQIDKLASQKYQGNSFAAWREGTPKQRKLVDAILTYPGHVICTMRSKTEYVLEENDRGKKVPKRVGMAPEQGKGIEYEFDMLIEMDVNNVAHVLKDRTGKFHGQYIDKPGADFGKELADWLSDGKKIEYATEEQQKELADLSYLLSASRAEDLRAKLNVMTKEDADKTIIALRAKKKQVEKKEVEPDSIDAKIAGKAGKK
jgi:hypothetical protein